MSLINSLFAGVSGLRNHQSMMDVIGNNIANVNSIGYKGSRVTFSDTFNQFVRYGTNPTDVSGGTNTFQVGLGMKLNSIDRNWNQGTFERTGIVTDLAVQGKGLFILENNGETFYSRAGAFTFDAEGKLVNPQNGAIVQGKVATSDGVIPPGNNLEDIMIDTNLRLPAVATTSAIWGGNLDSTASITRSENYVQTGNINSGMSILKSVVQSGTINSGVANGAVAGTETKEVTADDGTIYNLVTTFTKTADNTYGLVYSLNTNANPAVPVPGANNTSSPIEVVFDSEGNISTMNGISPYAINILSGSNGIDFDYDLSAVTEVASAANLISDVSGDTVTDSNTIYDADGNEYTLSSTYTKTAADTYDLTYELTDADGNVIDSNGGVAMSVVFDGTTGAMSTVNYNDGNGGVAPVAINISDSTLGINFNFDFTDVTQTSNTSTVSSTVDDNRDTTIVTGTVSVFDSLGNSHTLTVKFTKTSSNNWNWTANLPATSGTLSSNTGTVSFNPDGSVNTISPNPPVLTFAPSGGAQAENITLDFGSGFDGITQTSSDSVLSALSQNGSGAATLSNLSIDQYGYIVGVFSNGQSKQLAQVMMATFANLNGLTSSGENMFTVSANSGDPLIGEPGEATGTTIQSGALEQSNVDLSEEFTRMIVSQRGFQANARVITTSDSLLQEITNLVR